MSEFYSFDSRGRLTRNSKGKSFIDFPDTYVVIDLETTGLDSSYDDIIEISALKIINNEIVESYESLIKPDCLFYSLDPFITEITGITEEDLKTAPLLKEVLNDYLEFIGNNIIVGHNVNFDINFLYTSCVEILNKPFINDFIDTLRLSRKLHKELESHRLDDLIKHYNIGERNLHRALNDCILTMKLFENLKKTTYNQSISFI